MVAYYFCLLVVEAQICVCWVAFCATVVDNLICVCGVMCSRYPQYFAGFHNGLLYSFSGPLNLPHYVRSFVDQYLWIMRAVSVILFGYGEKISQGVCS